MNPYQNHFNKMKNDKKIHVKRKQNKKRKIEWPMKPILLCMFGFFLSLYGMLYPQQLQTLFSGYEVGFFSKSLASDGAKMDKTKIEKEEKAAVSENNDQGEAKSDSKKIVYKDSSHIKALLEKEKQLVDREEHVKKLEAKLQKEKEQLDKKLKRLEKARREIASRLERRVKEDDESIMKLVGIYSNMKPKNAAYLIMQLDTNLAVSVLKKMKKRQAGSVLNFVDPAKAKELSELYSGY